MAHIKSNVDLGKAFDTLKSKFVESRQKFDNSQDEYRMAVLSGELTAHIWWHIYDCTGEDVNYRSENDIPENLFTSPSNSQLEQEVIDEMEPKAEGIGDDAGNGNFQF